MRNPDSSSIKELQNAYPKDRFAVVTIDYSDYPSIKKAAEEAAKILPRGLDYLISNAGVSLQENSTFKDMYACFALALARMLIPRFSAI